LYETPFRNYDPRLGRWLSPDPIQHPWQGSYTAFNNNPIYFVDPLGLEGDENDGSGGDDDDEQFFGPYGTGVVTVTPDEEGNNNNGNMPMTGKAPEEILSEVQPVNPAPTMDDLNHVDIFEPTSEKVSRKQFNRDFNFFIRNASDETVGELISRDSRLPLRLKLRAIRITVRDGQTEFLTKVADFSADASSMSLKATGTSLTYLGTGIALIPGGQGPAGVLISTGGTLSAIGSGIDAAQGYINGNYTKGHYNVLSVGTSYAKGFGIQYLRKSTNATQRTTNLIDGGSSIGQDLLSE